MLHEQLTENDVKKIKEEIEYRKLTVRKNAIEAVKEARAHGDLSENFEYHAAKKDKREPYPLSGENVKKCRNRIGSVKIRRSRDQQYGDTLYGR